MCLLPLTKSEWRNRMKNFLTDHRFLNVENVKLINSGDIVRWKFSTELNGVKDETVIFHQVVNNNVNSYWSDINKIEDREVPSIDCTYKNLSFGRQKWAHVREDKFWFSIWTNGYNLLRVISVNDRSWDEILDEKGLNRKSERQQEAEQCQLKVNKLINLSSAEELDCNKGDYERVYQLLSIPNGFEIKKDVAYLSVTTGVSNVLTQNAYLTTQKNYDIKKEKFQFALTGIEIYVSTGRHEGIKYNFLLPDQDINEFKKELKKRALSAGKLIEEGFCKGGIKI